MRRDLWIDARGGHGHVHGTNPEAYRLEMRSCAGLYRPGMLSDKCIMPSVVGIAPQLANRLVYYPNNQETSYRMRGDCAAEDGTALAVRRK